ncbi:MAG: bifunctional (p)ppGpp synthetase/guanosine-3',5'-bis(diphosphate) 3'-pyrophosphohydrolase [Polaromonas sp.]|jgi:GTP pyrophosphokinase|uniref:RelA/SpoT family protein n=1 Tax=Polaromonas sp. TaxID=1869339 RepID=UPI002730E450|nr:bifunctional (p)ppGpp synthetase/guanosine-3',5'-bis(diphosphate) 3'-pyrophosphohydrolase [Polaromonas sp.]MDP2255869.1 bifunctional (p)ppGpp synthetase/guanosine-3',5'-bis(diphosphate) 3'-pyrophosphohydrolase [Polaromonas sp.]MDP3708445.1 bifunctional (p)ppGpp synthetase/guanosine-3',5'-bis(diphosphate) 3'-pyrophosphohydrolase [Polaromonas sp.]
MKSHAVGPNSQANAGTTGGASASHGNTASIVTATADSLPDQPQALARARAFAEPLIASETLDTGENILAHADAVAAILKVIGGSEAMQAATYLVHACQHLNKPLEVITKAFGANYAALAVETTKLVLVQRQARSAGAHAQLHDDAAAQTENVRKMLLAFSRDLRVVMLRLASRLQTLRYFAAVKQAAPASLAHESLHVFAPLANRLGIWQIKWEMEDLAFRFFEPETYQKTARLLDEKRVEREEFMEALRAKLEGELNHNGIAALVQGRPKHIYSIVKKMRGKSLDFEQVFDIRALRVIAADVKGCYAALGFVHSRFTPIEGEFDDYIAKPKSNGYQSLHTVVRDEAGRAVEIQIRTQAMHDHAEHGVAAHWAYKEAGTKGYSGVSASSDYDAKIAVLRQLLAWERDLSGPASARAREANKGLFEDRIYVLTPDAAIVELPQGATTVDFAYSVHTSLGHRCRGARIDGAMVPLNTPLQNGQTVEVITAKEGGPSRDWLNPELGFLSSHRAKSKVRAWFNALAMEQTVAKGREAVEKLLQREGKTAMKLDDLAAQLGFKAADDLFEVVGKDELSLRTIENMLRPQEPALSQDDYVLAKKIRPSDKSSKRGKGNVLVVGLDSLLTQLAKCCKPAPPDEILGFVTKGKGVSIHRSDCSNFRNMASGSPDRVIEVEWSSPKTPDGSVYPVDVAVEAADRQGLLRDISEVFAKEKMNVIGVQTQSVKDNRGGTARMTFTVEVAQSGRLNQVLGIVADVAGVRSARRR